MRLHVRWQQAAAKKEPGPLKQPGSKPCRCLETTGAKGCRLEIRAWTIPRRSAVTSFRADSMAFQFYCTCSTWPCTPMDHHTAQRICSGACGDGCHDGR